MQMTLTRRFAGLPFPHGVVTQGPCGPASEVRSDSYRCRKKPLPKSSRRAAEPIEMASSEGIELLTFQLDASRFIGYFTAPTARTSASLATKGLTTDNFPTWDGRFFDSHATLYTGEVHFTRWWDGLLAALSGKVDETVVPAEARTQYGAIPRPFDVRH